MHMIFLQYPTLFEIFCIDSVAICRMWCDYACPWCFLPVPREEPASTAEQQRASVVVCRSCVFCLSTRLNCAVVSTSTSMSSTSVVKSPATPHAYADQDDTPLSNNVPTSTTGSQTIQGSRMKNSRAPDSDDDNDESDDNDEAEDEN
jgi:hypothetical protein